VDSLEASALVRLVAIRRAAYGQRSVVRPQRGDLEALLAFLGDVAELEFYEPYPVEVVARVQDLVRCDAVTYQELDLHAKRCFTMVGISPKSDDDDDDDDDDADEAAR